MYLLDTNVISELRKAKVGKADKNVLKWSKSVSSSTLFISVITIMELEKGALLMERRDVTQGAIIRSWIDSQVLPGFTDRILPIDIPIAKRCAKLYVPNPQANHDALIAATSLVHSMILVTRNVSHFKNINIKLLNPWEKREKIQVEA